MATLQEVEQALRAADAAGNVEDATVLAAEYTRLKGQQKKEQPSVVDRAVGSPVGRLAHDAIVAPVMAIPRLANWLFTPNAVKDQLKAAGKDYQDTPINRAAGYVEDQYQGALERNRNTPGYADARARIEAKNTNMGGGVQDQMISQFIAPIAGMVALPGGLDESNAYADYIAGNAARFQEENPALSFGANVAGGFVGIPAGNPLRAAANLPRQPAKAGSRLPNVAKPFSAAGREEIVGRVLNDIAGPNGVKLRNAPLPGMKVSLGQSSNNPAILEAERALQMRPGMAQFVTDARQANNEAITNAIVDLGLDPDNASHNVLAALKNAEQAGRNNYRAAWKAAGVDEMTGINFQALKQTIDDYVGSLTIPARQNIPSSLITTLDDIARSGTTNLKSLQDWRANALSAGRTAARSGDENTARILSGLVSKVDDFTQDVRNFGPTYQQNLAAWDKARESTKTFKRTFREPKEIRNTLSRDRYGADKVPESAVADQFVRSGKGAKEALDSYIKAVGSDYANLQPIRDAFSAKFLKEVRTTVPDQGGALLTSAPSITKFIQKHQHVINSPAFTQSQRDVIRNILDGANMAQRTARAGVPGGSDTAAKLLGNEALEVMIGPKTAKIGSAVGATVGAAAGTIAGGPLGGIAGAAIGVPGGKLLPRLYSGSTDKVINTLQRAMSDPAYAKTLMDAAKPIPRLPKQPAMRAIPYLSTYPATEQFKQRRQ